MMILRIDPLRIAFPVVLLFIGLGVSCKPNTSSSMDDACGPVEKEYAHQIIRFDPNDFYQLNTPDAKNDCEAQYRFFFRWADPLRRAVEQPGHEEMPPLQNMAQGFQPLGEYAYFPHPNAKYDPDAEPPTTENYGKGWWVIDFFIGNKNSSNPSTKYYVRARLDPGTASSSDSTEIYCAIYYYPISK